MGFPLARLVRTHKVLEFDVSVEDFRPQQHMPFEIAKKIMLDSGLNRISDFYDAVESGELKTHALAFAYVTTREALENWYDAGMEESRRLCLGDEE